jgi:hypothetical protein
MGRSITNCYEHSRIMRIKAIRAGFGSVLARIAAGLRPSACRGGIMVASLAA